MDFVATRSGANQSGHPRMLASVPKIKNGAHYHGIDQCPLIYATQDLYDVTSYPFFHASGEVRMGGVGIVQDSRRAST